MKQNVNITIKLKSDSVTFPYTIHRESEGLFIGEDWYDNSEIKYYDEEEILSIDDGRIQIQL